MSSIVAELQDQNWRKAVAFLDKHVSPSDCVLIPPELKPYIHQPLICSYALTHKGIAPEHVQWAVLHKGMLNDIYPPFLAGLYGEFRLRFANDVFVILGHPSLSPRTWLLPINPHVRAYRKQAQQVLQAHLGAHPGMDTKPFASNSDPTDFVTTSESLGDFVPNVDVLLCSYPKCGRTWLRFMLTAYIHLLCQQDEAITFKVMHRVIPEYRREDNIPPEKRLAARQLQDRYGVPAIAVTHCSYDIALAAAILSRKDIVLILRSPYDVLVSQYFERVYRQDYDPKESLWDFIQHEQLLPHIVSYLNGWADHLWRHRHWVLTYEGLRQDTPGQLRRVIEFLNLPVDGDRLAAAIQLGSFENMRQLDRDRSRQPSSAQAAPESAPQNSQDSQNEPEAEAVSLRVRRGAVGGYRDYLQPQEISAMQAYCRDRLSAKAHHLLSQQGLAL